MTSSARRAPLLAALLSVGTLAVSACGSGSDPEAGTGSPVEVTIPEGAVFTQVMDSLEARRVVRMPGLFSLWARMRGADHQVRAGRYVFTPGTSWGEALDALTRGRVATEPLTIPEGWTTRQIAPLLAERTGHDPDSLGVLLRSDSLARVFDVPGPGLEGYLFPDTYLFAEGVALETMLRTFTGAWKAYWTPEREARLDSLGRTRAEITTLASIIQAEAGNVAEMDTIGGVYANRLERGWLLQADPTVLYALGGPRARLLFAAIDSVADNPYNTYRNPGLPPGPIGSPGRAALDAALSPADVPFMFFVAGPHGGHVFSETQAEHNRAVAEYRQRRAAAGSTGTRGDTRR